MKEVTIKITGKSAEKMFARTIKDERLEKIAKVLGIAKKDVSTVFTSYLQRLLITAVLSL